MTNADQRRGSNREVALGERILGEVLADPERAALPHGAGFLRVRKDVAACIDQRGPVVHSDHVAGLQVLDAVLDAARSRRHHRQAAKLRFHDCVRHPLQCGGKQEQGGKFSSEPRCRCDDQASGSSARARARRYSARGQLATARLRRSRPAHWESGPSPARIHRRKRAAVSPPKVEIRRGSLRRLPRCRVSSAEATKSLAIDLRKLIGWNGVRHQRDARMWNHQPLRIVLIARAGVSPTEQRSGT